MSHHRTKILRNVSEAALVIAVTILLAFVPACSFIEGLIGGEDAADADAAVVSADGAATPQPPPLVPPGVDPTQIPDAAALAAAMQKAQAGQLPPGFDPSKIPTGVPTQIPDGGLPPGIDPSQLPPGIDPSKIPPGIDPSQLQGMDPSKLPPGVDPAELAKGVGDLPPGIDPSAMPPQLATLPPEKQAQLSEALVARQKLVGQIRRLNYVIDRNLTKNPADVVRLNRYVRAKREIDTRLEAMRKEHNIPREAFEKMLDSSGGGASK